MHLFFTECICIPLRLFYIASTEILCLFPLISFISIYMKALTLSFQIITFFNNEVYTNDNHASRLSFAADYLNGDASLLISDLQLTDSGEYHCKVKTGGKYHWSQVNLIVLGKAHLPGISAQSFPPSASLPVIRFDHSIDKIGPLLT